MSDTAPAATETAPMRVLVLGATGGTGRAIVRTALSRGYAVNALVRSRARAGNLGDAKLIEGDARDQDSLMRALEDCTSVISSLGTSMSPFKEVTLLSQATRALIPAMQAQQLRRLVCITGMGAGDSRGHGGFFYDRLMLPYLLRNVYQDKDRQEAEIRASGLDWVIVRPTMLTNKPATGRVHATTDLANIHGGAIPREDVAAFVVNQLTDDTWLHKTPLITVTS
jgi:uncharacterized protein YbjT (DUF2867 family)